MKKKRGRPPEKAWYISEENRELIKSIISRTKMAIALLESVDEFPVRASFMTAKSLLNLAKNEMYIIETNSDGFSPVEDFNEFIENCVEFAKNARETIKTLYDAYFEWIDACETDIKEGVAFSRHRFTTAMLNTYSGKIFVDVQRVNGSPPARCFIGLRLKAEEAENDG
jgi:hypothetical protein